MAKERAVPYRAQYIHKQQQNYPFLTKIKIITFRYILCAITQASLELIIPYLEFPLLFAKGQFLISAGS
jgi:hypothetical protein